MQWPLVSRYWSGAVESHRVELSPVLQAGCLRAPRNRPPMSEQAAEPAWSGAGAQSRDEGGYRFLGRHGIPRWTPVP